MKILEIHIYGYGKLEDVRMTNLREFQVFYGENEAGKSTIMSFIHSILFGFPTKQQTELRMEPKKGAKYGGQLVLFFEEQGRVVVERVKGKASGDVKVLFEDGTVGGEEGLQELLLHIDKSLYQAIFSFNLHGLQNVHQLKSEDLGKFLFSTGTIGTERLMTVEQQLQKEIDQLFKPSGRKPLINEKLKEVKSAYEDLKKAEQQNTGYGQLIQRKEELEQLIRLKQEQIHSAQKRIHQLEEWKKLAPIAKERELLKDRIESQSLSFPVDGLSRLDSVHQLLKPLEAQLKVLLDKRERLERELEEYRPNEELLEKEASIQHALENLPLYDTLQEEEAEWQSKVEHLLREIEEIKEKLHFPTDESKLEQCDTSIFMAEKTRDAEKKQLRIQEKKLELDDEFVKEKQELEGIEGQIDLLKKELLPDDVREAKKQKLEDFTNKASMERELKNIQDQIDLYQLSAKKAKEQTKQNYYQFLILCSILLIFVGWGMFKTQWLVAFIGGIGFLSLLFFHLKGKQSSNEDLRRKLQALKTQEQSLKEQLNNQDSSAIGLIKEQLTRDSLLQEQLTMLKMKWEQQNAKYDRIIQAFEEWEKEALAHQKLLARLGTELSIPEEIALRNIHSAFLLVEKLKEGYREYQQSKAQLEKKKAARDKIKEAIFTLGKQLGIEEARSVYDQAIQLREILKKELEKKQTFSILRERLEEVLEEMERVNKECSFLLKEREKLFQLADVHSEEDFRLLGKEAEKLAEWSNRMEELQKQIDISMLTESEIKEFMAIEDLPFVLEEASAQLKVNINEDEELRQELAEIKHQIALLEEGGRYGELLHQYRQLQSALDIDAKEWVKLSLAKEMLRRTVASFKQERLPTMLKKAEEYLAFLTDGTYIKIFPKGESNGFLIERKDHLLFEANELSQATTEQVYVSLRLALATTIYRKMPFPIIIDDSFVNFDHVRTEKVISLLKTLKENQVLFFTCHLHLLDYFSREDVNILKESIDPPIHSQ